VKADNTKENTVTKQDAINSQAQNNQQQQRIKPPPEKKPRLN